MTTPVIIRERWPDIPGHSGSTRITSARRSAESADGRYWLVRERGPFKRWHWLPVAGAFVSLFEVADERG